MMMNENRKPAMLRSVKDMIGYPVNATDGDIGKCVDFLFDDEAWTLRYLVADTRKWLPGRKVLISPYSFGDPDLGSYSKHFQVNLTKDVIKESPALNADAPVSRLYEAEMALFHTHPYYWMGGDVWGVGAYPTHTNQSPISPAEWKRHEAELRRIEKVHVRSADEVMGYQIAALDGEIGHVEDFVVETTSWTIRWMIVDTRNWLPGRKVIVAPKWIKEVSFPGRVISVDLLKDQIENAPAFDHNAPINRDYEGGLYDYYGRPNYWGSLPT